MERFNIHPLGLLAYIFIALLLYLSGMSFGGALEMLFYMMIFFICFSGIVFLFNILSIRFIEFFSTEHPVKGEEIKYTLSLGNESVFPLPYLKLSFRRSAAVTGDYFSDNVRYLGRNTYLSEEKFIRCPYRGIYEVGLEDASVSDLTGIFRYHPYVFFRTFYVYPKLYHLKRLVFEDKIAAAQAGVRFGFSDIKEDIDFVDEYRSGDSVRDIYWKRFFVTGKPFVKRYENSSKKTINMYIDLRAAQTQHPMETEDLSLEVLLAVSRYFLSKNTHMRAKGGGQVLLEGDSISGQFKRFYESTISIKFSTNISPFDDLSYDAAGNIKGNWSIVITHIPDYSLIEKLAGGNGVLIYNTAGKKGKDFLDSENFKISALGSGVNFLELNSSSLIHEVLE